MLKRSLAQIRRVPDQLLTVTLQPIIMIALFRYILGGAIRTSQASYVDFLMPGIFVISAVFVSMTTTVSIATDLLVGFRSDAAPAAWLAAIGLLLLVTDSFSWPSAVIWLLANSVEAAQQMGIVLVPLTFASGAFVPTQSMPGWLQSFAANQPLTQAIDAIRALLLGQPGGNHVWLTPAWCTGIVGVSVPLASLLFRRKTAS